MKDEMRVRLTKVFAMKPEQSPIPVGYWSEGKLFGDIELNHPIKMVRFRRSPMPGEVEAIPGEGIIHPGMFYSTPVLTIDTMTGQVRTANSTWKVSSI